jgi:outer membrane protein assembly factor BamB
MTNRNRRVIWTGTLLAATMLVASGGIALADDAAPTAGADWPQYCGPNRDCIAVSSPKLLDSWPKEGPPLAWKSDWIPGYYQGGCGGPAVADGRVFVYATWKQPLGGGNLYRLITPEALASAGWMPDLPAELAKKIEDARTRKGRPSCQGWAWWEIKHPKEKGKELDAFLAKKPELDKYVKDFIALLPPQDAGKYGDFIKKRLCMTPESPYGGDNAITWDGLEKLSTLQGAGYSTLREWSRQFEKATRQQGIGGHLSIGRFLAGAWNRCFTRSDTLVCLDAATGKTLWKTDFPLDTEALKLINADACVTWMDAPPVIGLCGTPAVSQGRCYFVGAMGLYCLSAKDGALIWKVKCPPAHSSVLVDNNVVYSCGAAYEVETGRLIWKTQLWKGTGREINSAPSLWRSGSKTYIIAGVGRNLVCCLDLETGKDLWALKSKAAWSPYGYANRIDRDLLECEGKAYRMTPTELQPLHTLGEIDPKQWGDTYVYHRVIHQDHLYAWASADEGQTPKVSGLCCWDLKTGDLKWNSKEPLPETLFVPSILADGKILMGLSAKQGYPDYVYGNYLVTMLKATPEKYVPLGSFDPGMIPWAPMALAGGKLFVRTEHGISCYDLTNRGPYLDNTIVTRDTVTFVFKQTGGGLVVKDTASGLKDVVITGAAGPVTPAKPGKPATPPKPATPAEATMAGDAIVVDIRNVPVPFGISCGVTNSLAGKNGQPVPAFGWNEARVLRFRTCFDNTIVLTSDLLLGQNGTWNAAATYSIAGATATIARVDPWGKTVTLTTDKAWNAGDAITLTYPRFHVDRGEALREALAFTARERSAVRFVKTDTTTSGSWKGIYGAQGAAIVGDAAATVACAVVTARRNESKIWAGSTDDARALQQRGEAKGRIAAYWTIHHSFFEIDIEFTDGKEHQVALYCLDWDKFEGGRAMMVEVWDPWTNVVLDKQGVEKFSNGKYLIWNLKGHVTLRLQGNSGCFSAVASGIFLDAPGKIGE